MNAAAPRKTSPTRPGRKPDPRRRITLKRDDTFLLCDALGDIAPATDAALGIYDHDTRVLSQLEFMLTGGRRTKIRSRCINDGAGLVVDYSSRCEGGTVHVRRRRFLHGGAMHERIALHNTGGAPVKIHAQFRYAADFADIFEVRGTPRKVHGTQHIACGPDRVTFHYRARDGRAARTHLALEPAPHTLDATHAAVELALAPGAKQSIFLRVGHTLAQGSPRESFCLNLHAATRQRRTVLEHRVTVNSDSPAFNTAFAQLWSDLRMLTTHTSHGLYPYAGTPWFSTAFGRDGIITALLTLWMAPALARGVLKYLAFYQAEAEDPARDAEPGKIVHEMRHGEMARLGEVPFGRYYGSIDATPLFLILMGAYYLRTDDRETVRLLWPHAERALEWIDRYGDRDGDGFAEYACQADGGLNNQGWKDSGDAIFHRNGELVNGPVALCEVQGYVYAAKRAAADIAGALGLRARANALNAQANALRTAFEVAFWRERLGTYALALDGDKRPCDVISSNAGQVLMSGIADSTHAQRVAKTLWSADCYSGWGIRTIARSAARYAPDSYHNGSVWPHDNAMIATGLARYGITRPLPQLLSAMVDAAAGDPQHRLPELFCGNAREAGQSPRPYPVACQPQAWAAAALPSLLQSCLGLHWNAARRELVLIRPQLPPGMTTLTLSRLTLGTASIDIRVKRSRDGVRVEPLATHGDIQLRVTA